MKYYLLKLFLVLSFSSNLFSWGDEGHKLITEKSFDHLPLEMSDFLGYKSLIIEHSIDPDLRKKDDPNEGPKHYIDIDFYSEFKNGDLVYNKDSLISLYGNSTVTKMGLLPWSTESAFENLTKAFRSGDKEEIILYASDLAHYVADGFQPLHACLNYDGQLTGQKGIHFRYEIKMVDDNIVELRNNKITSQPIYLKDIPNFILNYIIGSSIYSEVILSADNFCKNSGYNYENSEYYKLLWFRTKYLTSQQINSSALALASLYYTAWSIAKGK